MIAFFDLILLLFHCCAILTCQVICYRVWNYWVTSTRRLPSRLTPITIPWCSPFCRLPVDLTTCKITHENTTCFISNIKTGGFNLSLCMMLIMIYLSYKVCKGMGLPWSSEWHLWRVYDYSQWWLPALQRYVIYFPSKKWLSFLFFHCNEGELKMKMCK